MKQRTLRKALRIICLQNNIGYQDIADELGMTKPKLMYVVKKLYDPNHKKVCDYAKKHLDETLLTPKVWCVLNDITFKEYCERNGLNYKREMSFSA